MAIVIGVISSIVAFIIGWAVEMKVRPIIKESLEDMGDTVKSVLPKKK